MFCPCSTDVPEHAPNNGNKTDPFQEHAEKSLTSRNAKNMFPAYCTATKPHPNQYIRKDCPMKNSVELTRVSGDGTFTAKLTRDRKNPNMLFFATRGFVACLTRQQAIDMANHLADLLEDA